MEKQLEFHEYCLMFPPMGKEELEGLAEDIKVNGLRNPITLYEGKILDGRNRYLACLSLGITPVFKEYTGDTPLSQVMSENFMRRHLTKSQRAILAASAVRLRELSSPKSRSVLLKEVAAMYSVSPDMVRTTHRLQQSFPKDVVGAITDGKLNVNIAKKALQRAERLVGASLSDEKISPKDRETVEKVFEKAVRATDDTLDEELYIPPSVCAEEYQDEMLQGIFDARQFSTDLKEIQAVARKMQDIPAILNELHGLAAVVEQETLLDQCFTMIKEGLRVTKERITLQTLDCDAIKQILTNLFQDVLALKPTKTSKELSMVEKGKQVYLQACDALELRILELQDILAKKVKSERGK